MVVGTISHLDRSCYSSSGAGSHSIDSMERIGGITVGTVYTHQTILHKDTAEIVKDELVIQRDKKTIMTIRVCELFDMMIKDFPSSGQPGIARRRHALNVGRESYSSRY